VIPPNRLGLCKYFFSVQVQFIGGLRQKAIVIDQSVRMHDGVALMATLMVDLCPSRDT
jgi:hypothetical protein